MMAHTQQEEGRVARHARMCVGHCHTSCRAPRARANHGSAMQSLIKDESILSNQQMNHSSLIVDSGAKQPFVNDMSILSQEGRYASKKQQRGANAFSELRKSSKLPLNQQ